MLHRKDNKFFYLNCHTREISHFRQRLLSQQYLYLLLPQFPVKAVHVPQLQPQLINHSEVLLLCRNDIVIDLLNYYAVGTRQQRFYLFYYLFAYALWFLLCFEVGELYFHGG